MSRPIARQCKTCPWRKGSKNSDIPGYCPAKHAKLRDTIAEPGCFEQALKGELRLMSCHYSTEKAERMCVGWAANQLGEGNNIALRMKASRDGDKFPLLRTVGPQRANLEATINENDG